MIDFVTAPSPRVLVPLVLLGGAALSFVSVAPKHHECPYAHPQRYEMLLSATQSPGCVWGSAWNDGRVVVDARQLGQRIVFQRTYGPNDQCTWLATETLEPRGDGRYDYHYEEHVVSCDPSSPGPAAACERSGVAFLFATDATESATPMSAATTPSAIDPWDQSGCFAAPSDDELDDEDLDAEDVVE